MDIRSSLLLLFLFAPSTVLSQSPSADFAANTADSTATALVSPSPSRSPDSPGYRELSLYAGQSFGYPLVMSSLKDQRLFVLGIRFTHHWHTFRDFTLNWNADLKPLALYSNDIYGPRKYTYGAGFTFGAEIIPHNHWRCKPVFDMDGGAIAFSKDTPIPDTRRINLTFDFGPGLIIPLDETHTIKTGASFYHFSDDWTAPRNPNMDTFLIYCAFTFRNFPTIHHHSS